MPTVDLSSGIQNFQQKERAAADDARAGAAALRRRRRGLHHGGGRAGPMLTPNGLQSGNVCAADALSNDLRDIEHRAWHMLPCEHRHRKFAAQFVSPRNWFNERFAVRCVERGSLHDGSRRAWALRTLGRLRAGGLLLAGGACSIHVSAVGHRTRHVLSG